MAGEMSNLKQNGVIFRRVRGRIVPIRLNKEQKKRLGEAGKGTGLVVAGAGVAAAAGAAYRSILRSTTKMSARAMKSAEFSGRAIPGGTQLSFGAFRKASRASELAMKLSGRASRIASIAQPLRKGGIFAGSILIGIGASKLARAIAGEKNEKLEATVGSAASALAFNSKLTSKIIFQAGAYPKAFAAKGLQRAYPTLRKLKGMWDM